ncbi:unnamed protein product [Lupinus luteus]|uniref:Thiamine pyrophosphokinase n=1 Tax=Lupinus luteus TaxID=3873 RepID=A0AAV1X5F5_LUPLU
MEKEDFMCHASTFLLPLLEKENNTSTSEFVTKYALIILNQPLPTFTPMLWDHAQVRVCADGGANRLYHEMPPLLPHQHSELIQTRFVPDAIKGDMDSIQTEVLDFYKKLGTKIIDESQDQDTTDLHKCITYILNLTPDVDKSKLCILVVGALGGRFDHEVGNINVLCSFSGTRIILLSDDCLIHLLPKNQHHKIFIQSSVEGPHCGLIPIGMPCRSSTTTGLKWDLDNTEMKFGGLVSTSNIVKGDIVTVQSDSDLLWTISFKKL